MFASDVEEVLVSLKFDDDTGTLTDSAKLSGWVNEERTRNAPYGNSQALEGAERTSVTISLKRGSINYCKCFFPITSL